MRTMTSWAAAKPPQRADAASQQPKRPPNLSGSGAQRTMGAARPAPAAAKPQTPLPKRPVTILVAEDDPDDRKLMKEAFAESRLANDLRFVGDGEELMDYLLRRGKYADPSSSPRPGLLLLDLNMPKKDGRTALQEIKADPRFRTLRVVVLTTSRAEEDIARVYALSAASYIAKPVTFEALIEVVRTLGKYWLEIVELPEHAERSA